LLHQRRALLQTAQLCETEVQKQTDIVRMGGVEVAELLKENADLATKQRDADAKGPRAATASFRRLLSADRITHRLL
jgi:hypothetical protein